MGGSAIETDETVALNDPAPGIDNQAAIEGMCNAQVNNVGDFVNVCAASGLIDAAQVQEYQAAINQINNVLQTNPVTFDQAFSAINALEGVCGSMMTDCRGRIDQLKQSGVLSPEAEQALDAQFSQFQNQFQDTFQATQAKIHDGLLSSQVMDVIQFDIQNSDIDAITYPTRAPLSDGEAKTLAANTQLCLASNNPQDIKKLEQTISNLTANGLPEDQGSLNDIMTAYMIILLKYAMEGKKANREMSAEMAATIYQNAQKMAANILERGKLSFKQTMAGAFVNFAGAMFQSSMTIAGNVRAHKQHTAKVDNVAPQASSSSLGKADTYTESQKQAITSGYNAVGSAGSALTGLAANVTNAALGLKINQTEVENKELETNNRLNENAQQGIREVVESFNSLIKTTLQMMQSMNSLANQGQAAITGNMRS